jgi:hypothetical protein
VLLVQFSDQFVLPKLFDRFWLLQSVGVDFAQIAGSFRFLARSERQEKTKKAKLRWRSDHRSGIRLDRCLEEKKKDTAEIDATIGIAPDHGACLAPGVTPRSSHRGIASPACPGVFLGRPN